MIIIKNTQMEQRKNVNGMLGKKKLSTINQIMFKAQRSKN